MKFLKVVVVAFVFLLTFTVKAYAFCDISEKKLRINNKYFQGTVSTPNIQLDNRIVEKQWNEEMGRFQNAFLSYYQQEVISKTRIKSNGSQQLIPYIVTSNFSVPFCNARLISIVINNEIKKGSLSPTVERKTFNIDMESGKEISVAEIFLNKEKALQVVREEISKQMIKQKGMYRPDAFSKIQRLQDVSFYFTKTDLVIHIEQGFLTAKNEPYQEFAISYKYFGQNMNEQFLEKLDKR